MLAKKCFALLSLLLAAGAPERLRYTAEGDLIARADYREWIFLSSGIDMNYSSAPPMQGVSMFDNVFAEPSAWRAFKQTGHWPDKTMLAMEARGAASHGSINRHGQFQTTELMAVEFHVRDTARFKGGWAFFVQDGTNAKLVPTTANCYSCHATNGAVDTTFVQFYPIAKSAAQKAGTLTGN